jgi:hypothetical protein
MRERGGGFVLVLESGVLTRDIKRIGLRRRGKGKRRKKRRK